MQTRRNRPLSGLVEVQGRSDRVISHPNHKLRTTPAPVSSLPQLLQFLPFLLQLRPQILHHRRQLRCFVSGRNLGKPVLAPADIVPVVL